MKRYCFYFIIMMLCMFMKGLVSCSFPSKTEYNLLHINLNKVEKRKYLNASQVISKIEYVALETASECLLGETVSLSVSENYILAFSNYRCLLFSREGKFIRSIGQRGNGPSDFQGGSFSVKIDEKSGMIYLMSLIEIAAYRISGEFFRKLKISEIAKTVNRSFLVQIKHWKENLFCSDVNIQSGKEPYRLIFFNLEGEIVKLVPNQTFFKNDEKCYYFEYGAKIFSFDDQLFFKERPCDTLFKISEQFELEPIIIFDYPGKLPVNTRYLCSQVNAIDVKIEKEVKNYLWLYVTDIENVLFNKKNHQLISFERDPLLLRERTLPDGITKVSFPLLGLRNDIDGGLPLNPHYTSEIQSDNQIVSVYQSHLLKDLLTEEHFARMDIKDLDAHKRLRAFLANLDWDDNPVLMIATFK